ncbi:hypothetical protein MIND_00244600 [Mycena indigotica]|uniref:Leucine-rich repeat-containing protein 40 n=1 Tax=Mycena indigotica TaxID=2126181 RepID=A0A8H6WDB3_9AGAR|nr:uncharacterized protein MIND_00244600 [Mycena indigotica]KAF7312316.1 hypothetical protein MIND_00244600 [Mycena indigotica]
MSRVPQRGTSRLAVPSPRVRTTSTGANTKTASPSAANARIRTKSTAGRPPTSPSKPPQDESSKPPQLSLKEAIALKRAEAKKAQSSSRSSPLDDLGTLEDAIPNAPPPDDEDILGRPPLREAIERAKSTGSINLSTRGLVCIPSALFDIHLGITPEPLKSVPQEPPLPPAPEPPIGKTKRGPAWYETHDLEIIKAWGNEIVEIQPEIALFGSLKSVDLHKNKIASLPPQFADLAILTTLDISHNLLTALPPNLFSLPSLSNLNVSHNRLASLPFTAPFSRAQKQTAKSSLGSGGLFGPQIERATTPLPKLAILDASNNSFNAASIDTDLPKGLISLDLSGNELGDGHLPKLFAAFGKLAKLKTLRIAKAGGVDDALFADLSASTAFPTLTTLDLGETGVSESGARMALQPVLSQTLTFDVTNDDPPPGTTRVVVGKKVVREAWELEAERRAKVRGKGEEEDGIAFPAPKPASSRVVKRPTTATITSPKPIKEAWELEAEAGLLTEGGRRRARAVAAAKSNDTDGEEPVRQPSPTKAIASVLSDPQYYNSRSDTLTLPPTTPPPKSTGHARAFSLAFDRNSAPPRATDVSLPTATMPLTAIAAQPFAGSLRVLVLQGRRVDRVMVLPNSSGAFLPSLEELTLEGCNLSDSVSISIPEDDTLNIVTTPPVTEQRPLLQLIAQLFPSLKSLNLAYNLLTSAALGASEEVLASLVLSSASPARAGLRSLIMRGNRIDSLDSFQNIAMRFKSNRQVPGWTLEELDLRDNEIAKLPAEMGMLPLDVFLVDGNTFRVPARRVWEREGTKGLLSWLRGRME